MSEPTGPEQIVAATIGLRPVHGTDRQLRVDAVGLAVEAHEKQLRLGEKETPEQYDERLVATARAIHAFLVEQDAPDAAP